MSRLACAGIFRELEVYRKARPLAGEVFEVSKSFPNEERCSLTDRSRRASRWVGGQIAEAWAKRRHPRHVAGKLTGAGREQNENRPWIEVAYDSARLDDATRDHPTDLRLEVGRMLGSVIHNAEGFSGNGADSVREETATCPVEGPVEAQSE